MNIESTSSASPPQRTAASDVVLHQAERASAAQGKSAKATEATEAAKKSQPTDGQSRIVPSGIEVEDAVKRLTEFVAPTGSEISFSVDDTSGVRIVKILDSQSKDVIRQIPSEEAVELARALDKLQGLLIKDKA